MLSKHSKISLNPCSNGRYSQRYKMLDKLADSMLGLNPCSNGRYSQSYWSTYGITFLAWS